MATNNKQYEKMLFHIFESATYGLLVQCSTDRARKDASSQAQIFLLGPAIYFHCHHFTPEELLFLEPSRFFRTQGPADFCSLISILCDLVDPTFANIWQSCLFPALSIFFGFSFLAHQLVSVMIIIIIYDLIDGQGHNNNYF